VTPKTEKGTVIWKHPLPPIAKKFKVMPSVMENIAIVFEDYKGDA
jgi:hypothetical protein